MKQDKNDIFEIDFAGKKTPSKKMDSSFFDFSIKGNQPVAKKVEVLQDDDVNEDEVIDTENTAETEAEAEVEVEVEVEAKPEVSDDVEVAKVSFAKSNHADKPVHSTDENAVQVVTPVPSVPEAEVEVKVSSFKRVPAAPISNSEETAKDDVSITSVSWHKKTQTGQPLYRRTNVSPAPVAKTTTADAPNNDDLPAKKNSLIIETEDGFEIKMCNFRKLAGKGQVSAPNNKIKKN